MTISITAAQKAKLKGTNYLVLPLPGATGSDYAQYHNPKNGQELTLPADPYHMSRYIARGLRLGPAPAGLVYTPPEDPLNDPEYRHDLPKTTDEGSGYIQLLEQRIAALEGKDKTEKNPEINTTDEQLPLF